MKEHEIILRHFTENDAQILLKWGQDQRYHDLAGFEMIQNLNQAQKAAKQYAQRKNSYAICLDNKDKVIGLVELYERGLDERSGLLKTKEIGFMLDKEYEGKGYMTTALTMVINMAFKKQRQNEIWAGTYEDNARSQKLLEKLGFRYIYTIDYSQVTYVFSYKEKYYLLKKEDWLKIVENTKS